MTSCYHGTGLVDLVEPSYPFVMDAELSNYRGTGLVDLAEPARVLLPQLDHLGPVAGPLPVWFFLGSKYGSCPWSWQLRSCPRNNRRCPLGRGCFPPVSWRRVSQTGWSRRCSCRSLSRPAPCRPGTSWHGACACRLSTFPSEVASFPAFLPFLFAFVLENSIRTYLLNRWCVESTEKDP